MSVPSTIPSVTDTAAGPPVASAGPPLTAPAAPPAKVDVGRLRDLSSAQWKSGIAAWLGWLFDGLDMHLYTIVAAPFVFELLGPSATEALVKEKSSWIQAAFLIGWALGGGFFGRIGDRLGRSRALSLTILTYAMFTGLSFFAQTWWQLLICRFTAALGIGGEWAVGSSLLSETWPRRWRAWIAAVLQTGVNIGVMLAYAATWLMAGLPPRYVFLVGILAALLVYWIRRHVPEPDEWTHARNEAAGRHAAHQQPPPDSGGAGAPGVLAYASPVPRHPEMMDLFRGDVRRITLFTIVVCACSLTAWWAVMFWTPQLMPKLPDAAGLSEVEKKRLAATTLGILIGVSIAGNFFAGWMARLLGYRKAVSLLCLMFFASVFGAFIEPRTINEMKWIWLPLIGFCSGLFGLFTMFLPPLFPVLLRTTGAGFSYNIGRIAAAVGTVVFGIIANNQLGDLRIPLLYGSFLFLPAMLVALLLPDLHDIPKDAATTELEPVE